MQHYPVFLDLKGRPCFVIGGCALAEEKVKGLLAAGARVTVISPDLTPGSPSSASRESRLRRPPLPAGGPAHRLPGGGREPGAAHRAGGLGGDPRAQRPGQHARRRPPLRLHRAGHRPPGRPHGRHLDRRQGAGAWPCACASSWKGARPRARPLPGAGRHAARAPRPPLAGLRDPAAALVPADRLRRHPPAAARQRVGGPGPDRGDPGRAARGRPVLEAEYG